MFDFGCFARRHMPRALLVCAALVIVFTTVRTTGQTPVAVPPQTVELGPWKIKDSPIFQPDGVIIISGAERTDGQIRVIFMQEATRSNGKNFKFSGIDETGKVHAFVQVSSSTKAVLEGQEGKVQMTEYEPETGLDTNFQIQAIKLSVTGSAEKTREIAPGEGDIRSKVSRVRADQRSLATALESYFIDNNDYPAWTQNVDDSIHGGPAKERSSPGWALPAFRRSKPEADGSFAMTLTTPIAYITSYFDDPFASGKGHTFQYYAVKLVAKETPSPTPTPDPQGRWRVVWSPGMTPEGNYLGWIVWSPGPDGKYDLDWKQYKPGEREQNAVIINQTFDPTNGTMSGGDVWRSKQ